MNNQVQILPSKKIDPAKWDACVRNSPHGVIYALSIYLNHMADNWTGIVLGDYEAVLPIPWRKKMGIRYTYDVPFVQQLGWFAKNSDDFNHLQTIFMQQLFAFVQYGSYTFNHSNSQPIAGASMQNNYILNLSNTYNKIAENYKQDALNNLKKAGRANLLYQACPLGTAIGMFVSAYSQRFANTTKSDYRNFTALCQMLQQQQQAFARRVVDGKSGAVLSAAVFFTDNRRMYNIMNTTVEEGRQKSANHFLLDNVFKEFAGTGLVFDFEGSDIEGIKLFYEKFGAENQPYQRLGKFNRLPFPLSLLKR
jgi:hypothetical protein